MQSRYALPALALAAIACLVMPRVAASTGAGGKTYYLDSRSGNDAAAGTRPGAAWRSLARANATPLQPGDRLLLRRGAVWTGPLVLDENGTARDRIVVGAYGRGGRPLIRGGSTCVQVGGSYVRVTSLRVDGCSWAGISVSGDFDTIDHSLVSHNAVGIEIGPESNSARVSFNDLVDNDRMSVLTQTPSDDDSGAFGILIRGDGARVTHNRISGSDAFSYDYGRDGSAVEIYGGRGNLVAYNVAVDDHAFSELGNPRAADNTFAYNLFETAGANATFVVTRGAKDGRGPVAHTRLYNNTAYLTGTDSQGVVCYAGCSAEVLTMRNNVVVARLKAAYADAPFDEAADVFDGPVQMTLGPGAVVANPRFTAPARGDFRLLRSSPAVDRGVPVGFTRDLGGSAVPLDGNGDGAAAPDAGAFEYRPPPAR